MFASVCALGTMHRFQGPHLKKTCHKLCITAVAGVHCETNIDECASGPCEHGTCVDGVNRYSCSCLPGYRGDRCETEIDECHVYRPCHNGATCIDRVASYDCVCPAMFHGTSYGGRNCTVKLIGCENHHCKTGTSTCRPRLVDEQRDLHDYTCICSQGYTGQYCSVVTTATFSGSTWMWHQHSAGQTTTSVSLRFRTTLTSGLLVVVATVRGDKNVILQLVNEHTLQVISSDPITSVATTLRTGDHVTLNNAAWHQVELTLNETGLWVSLQQPDCDGSEACGGFLAWDTKPVFRNSYFGGNKTLLHISPTMTLAPNFIGCMQDITVNRNMVIVPNDAVGNGFAHELIIGCARTDQCIPDPCSGHGTCTDLWHQFRCSCRRPYFDVDCSKSKCVLWLDDVW